MSEQDEMVTVSTLVLREALATAFSNGMRYEHGEPGALCGKASTAAIIAALTPEPSR